MIDTHVHIWRLGHNDCLWPPPELQRIHRDFGLADVAGTIAGAGVNRVILVQSQPSAADTAWLLAQAEQSDLVAGVVGGLAEYFGVDPTLARVAYVVVSIISAAFPGLLVYALLWLVMPEGD